MITKTIQPEVKYIDTVGAMSTLNASSQQVCLTPVTQNITDTARIGDALTLRRILFRSQILFTNAVGVTPYQNFIRVIMFQWRPQATIVGPSLSNILSASYTPSSVWSYVSMPYNRDTRHQFRILMDVMVPVDLYHCQRWKTKIVRKFNKTVQYSAGTTVATGHVFLVALADTLVGGPTLNYNVRLEYTDS